jgi:predicted Zn-dependent protease
MTKFPKAVKKASLALAVSVCVGMTTLPAMPAEAIDLGTIIGAAATYGQYDQQLNYLENDGRNTYLEQVKKENGVNASPEANAMLERIMTRLSASIAQVDPTITKKPYNYFVNNDTSFNAFCTLGHNLSVNIGAFDTLAYNEDELAVVIAHELGHGQKKHPLIGNRKALATGLIAGALSSGASGYTQLGASLAYNIGKAKLITKPQEVEADKLAFTYYTGAGYNIGAGAAVWERVLEKSNGTTSGGFADLLNDHPTNVSRLDTYNKNITNWSNGVVKVDSKTGMISLHNKDFYTPPAAGSLSAKERSYLIAGNLSAVYHDKNKAPGAVTVDGNNIISVGNQQIMTVIKDDPETIKAKLQKLL